MTFRRSAPAALIAAVVIVVVGLTRPVGPAVQRPHDVGRAEPVPADAVHRGHRVAQRRRTRRWRAPTSSRRCRRRGRPSRPRTASACSPSTPRCSRSSGTGAASTRRSSTCRPRCPCCGCTIPPSMATISRRFRPIVAAVNRERAARKGFAIARRGPAIFGVAPIRRARRPPRQLRVRARLRAADRRVEGGLWPRLLAVHRGAAAARIRQRREPGGAERPEPRRPVRALSHHEWRLDARPRRAMPIFPSSTSPAAIRATRRASPYGVLLVPLRDGAGDSLGVIAAARDFSGSRAAAGRSLVWQICLAVFAIVLLSGAVIVVVRGFLLRPLEVLEARFAALAARRTDDGRGGHGQVLRRDAAPGGSSTSDPERERARGERKE